MVKCIVVAVVKLPELLGGGGSLGVRRLALTGFYDAEARGCPAGTLSTYDAIVCPPSHFKHAEASS